MKKRTEQDKQPAKMDAKSVLYVIVLLVLAGAVITLLSLWFLYEEMVYLYAMLGVFGVYVVFLVVTFLLSDGLSKKERQKRELLKAALGGECLVYCAYFGGEGHVKRPSKRKKEYLVEVYETEADGEALKKHLWFGLPEQEERKLALYKRFEGKFAYSALALIEHKTVYLAAGFYEAAKDAPAFAEFLSSNQIVLYGDN